VAGNQRQKYAPPADNGAASRTWDSRSDPTLKFLRIRHVPRRALLKPAFTNIRVQRKRLSSRFPETPSHFDSFVNNYDAEAADFSFLHRGV
jgi:hypothetical protein